MACAALKRPYNFDLLANSPQQSLNGSPKRRRCGASATVSPARTVSPFLEATPKLSIGELASNVQDEWRRIHRRRKLCGSPPSNTDTTQGMGGSSPMHNTWSSPLASRYSQFQGSSSPPRSMSPGSMSPPRGKDQPALTIKQVVSLCERLWKEREEKLREEYDTVLTDRLAEQYDSFLKFTQDQIMRKYEQSSCSYVS